MNTIAELWRYPVKSFQGEQRRVHRTRPERIAGRPGYAVVDPAARKVLSAKRYADLLMASAHTVDGSIVLTLPTGDEFAADDDKVHAALSEWLGKDVRLDTPPTEGVFPMEMYSGMSDESTPLFDWPGPPGTWLDLADAHFLTTASLGEWDVRRFRPTALIESSETEEGWDTVSLGSVEAKVIMPTPRCSMPSRAQPGLERDMSVGKTIRDTRGNNLGVYCSITKAGTLNVGDAVTAS